MRQQVLTEIWRRGGDYDPRRASVLTWALMIARSRAADERRKRRPEPVDPTMVEDTEAVADTELDRLVERWRVAALPRAHPGRRGGGTLRMRFYEGLSQSQIADRIRRPAGDGEDADGPRTGETARIDRGGGRRLHEPSRN